MNQAGNEAPNLNLPPPVVESAPASSESAQVEQAPAAPERAPQASQTIPAGVMPVFPTTQDDNSVQTDDDAKSTSGMAIPKMLEDKDLIEKEWVSKAKVIVNRTIDDPHKQTEEVSSLKADYLQENYNKTLKLSK